VAGALMGPGTNLDSEVLDALGLGAQMEYVAIHATEVFLTHLVAFPA
jgi:hypothetical protein